MTSLSQCYKCDYERFAHEGFCTKQLGSDEYVVRCVGPWTEDKHYYLKKYLDAFTTATYKTWSTRNYIELFAGPGICLNRASGSELTGSPLIALQCEHPFTNCSFVEKNRLCMHALRNRVSTLTQSSVSLYENDCNEIIEEIASSIDKNSVSLAFIDPTGIQIDFTTIVNLTTHNRIDLIINFSHDMAIERNAAKWLNTAADTPLDRFLGTRDWRPKYAAIVDKNEMHLTARTFIDIYKQQLIDIGYSKIASSEPHIRSSNKNLPLYYLLFASKVDLGYKLWNDVTRQNRAGQRPLF